MKSINRIIAVLTGMSLLMSIAACSVKTEKDVIESQQSAIESKDYYNIEENVKADGYEFKVHHIHRFYEEGTGTCYILALVTYTNTTNEKITLNTQNDILCYIDNEQAEYVSHYDNPAIIDDNLLLGNSNQINPGRSKSGVVIWAYYRTWNSIEIQCNDTIIAATARDVIEMQAESVETIPAATATNTPTPTLSPNSTEFPLVTDATIP